jgi:hypothetical protein
MKDNWYYARGYSYTSGNPKFFPIDTEELYEKNLKENRAELEENGWIPLPPDERCVGHRYLYNPKNPGMNDWVELSYNINSHGFRCEEMPAEKKPRSIITIGCSNTFGVGMPVGQIWPTLVGNTLRQRPYNLGVPAGSLDTAFRVLLAWLPKIRPSHVFLLEPPGVRYETHTQSIGVCESSIHNPMPVGIRFEHEDEWELHREKTMRAIKSLCDQFDTPLISMQLDDSVGSGCASLFGKFDSARDLMHPGRNVHTYIAMCMLKKAGYEWDIEKNENGQVG